MSKNNTLIEGLPLGDKFVNSATLEVDGVDTKDYPDFCDAYFDYAEFTDGTELTEDELIEFQEQYSEMLGELAFESLL